MKADKASRLLAACCKLTMLNHPQGLLVEAPETSFECAWAMGSGQVGPVLESKEARASSVANIHWTWAMYVCSRHMSAIAVFCVPIALGSHYSITTLFRSYWDLSLVCPGAQLCIRWNSWNLLYANGLAFGKSAYKQRQYAVPRQDLDAETHEHRTKIEDYHIA
eukprot:6460156-Amphidinium_carterae.1